MIDLFWSAVSLLMFWLIGALVFSKIEGWNYGWVFHLDCREYDRGSRLTRNQ